MAKDSGTKLALYGSVSSIIGLLVAIGVIWFGFFEARKALSVEVLSKGTWFTGPLSTDFRLTYKNEPIQNVASVLIQIRNTGRQPIEVSDFEKPLKIAIKGTSKISSVEQVGAEPSDLSLNLSSENSDVFVDPTLFNPGDMARVLVTAICSVRPEITVDLTVARIAGIRSVDFETTLKPNNKSFSITTTILGLISGMLASAMAFLLFPRIEIFMKKENKELMLILEDEMNKTAGMEVAHRDRENHR